MIKGIEKTRHTLNFIGILLMGVWGISCSEPDNETSILHSPGLDSLHNIPAPFRINKLDSAVVYCWCFKDGQSRCMTFAAVKPGDLCDTNHYLLSITGFPHVPNLQSLLNGAKVQKNKWGTRDARFVIQCFEKDSSFVLTYADYNDSTLWIDGDRELKCNAPILAWIMNEMELNEIECPD